jgi:hypothetical protein
VAENPLEQIKFRESEEPAETPVAEGAANPDKASTDDDKLKSGPSHRPYSFQQRKKQR